MTTNQGAQLDFLRPRRIGFCGGTALKPKEVEFCRLLGRELVKDRNVIIMTGGAERAATAVDGNPNVGPTVDREVVRGAVEAIAESTADEERQKREEQQIVTLLPGLEDEDLRRFRIGTVNRMERATKEARRFALVKQADALVILSGERSTAQMIELAVALEKPCLPLPFTEDKADMADSKEKDKLDQENGNRNAAQRMWRHYLEVIKPVLQSLEDKVIKTWLEKPLSECSTKDLITRVHQVVKVLNGALARRCFIAIPFDKKYARISETLVQAAKKDGFYAFRADSIDLAGDVMNALRTAITNCDCMIADISQNNPNVFYEIGFAHALGKPIILLCEQSSSAGQKHLDKFDLRNDRRWTYSKNDLPGLEKIVQGILVSMFPAGRSTP